MIRAATPADIPAIHQMIRDLAEHHDSDEAEATDEQLRTALFGRQPAVFALISEEGSQAVGLAVWYLNFSTWSGTHGVYLEDLFVQPEHRGAGHGKALLAALAEVCVERGYNQFEWSVHDLNEPTIAFYKALGAQSKDVWTVYRLSGPALRELAATSEHSHSVNPREVPQN